MKLNGDAQVKTDSKASIKFTGLMGQNYRGHHFGSPGAATGEGRHADGHPWSSPT